MGLKHKTWKQELLKGVRVGLVSAALPVLCCALASKHGCASSAVIHQLVVLWVQQLHQRFISMKVLLKMFLVPVSMTFDLFLITVAMLL